MPDYRTIPLYVRGVIFAQFAIVLLLVSLSATAQPLSNPATSDAPDTAGDRTLNWYYFVAAVNVYPRLESEDIVHQVLEPVLRGLAPGHQGVHTIGGLRDEHLLWPPHFGLGVNLSPRWSVFLEAGYTAGKVRTKVDRPSIVLLPLHTDFEIQRSGLFAGVGVDYFPWGTPAQKDYDGFRSRLAQIRPFLGTRLTWTRATYDAKVKIGLQPFPNLVNLKFADAWTLPSITTVAGVDIPVSRDTTIGLNAAYNDFWRQELDFEGYAFTVQLRHYFGKRYRHFASSKDAERGLDDGSPVDAR